MSRRPGMLSGGRPLPNTSVHVCDSEGNAVPPGVVGELWLGGAGLARGYVGRPDLTAAAFVETAHGRRYRSGDLGRWRATGEIEILGRIDDQVKLNGIRVELGEIEHALASHPDIAQAVALLDGDAETKPKVCGPSSVPGLDRKRRPEESWREYLAGRLPAYMIPSAVIAVPGIPADQFRQGGQGRTEDAVSRPSASVRRDFTQDGLEAEIAGLWSELAGQRSRDDSSRRQLLRPRRSQPAGHCRGAPPGKDARPSRAGSRTVRGTDARRLRSTGRPNGSSGNAGTIAFSDRATEGQREFWVAEHAGLDTRGFNIALDPDRREAMSNAAWRELWWRATMPAYQLLRGSERRAAPLGSAGDRLRIWRSPASRTKAAALAHMRERQTEPSSWRAPPLWRAGLVHVAAMDQPVFWLALHHSVGDGVSLGVLAEELSTLLEGGTLPPIAGHFDRPPARKKSIWPDRPAEEDAPYWRKNSWHGPQSFDEWPLDFPVHWAARRGTRKERTASAFAWMLQPPPACAISREAMGPACMP